MPKMVIEVPEELTEVGKAMAEHLAELQGTLARHGNGKAVDYAKVERQFLESSGRIELAAETFTLDGAPISATRKATSAVLVAGLLTMGIPASRAQAAFSAVPQAGKLKALMCTATPSRGTQRWIPE